MPDQKPSIGRVVHYVSYGTPGGEFSSECRAAIITDVDPAVRRVSLAVLNPTGMFFNGNVAYDDSQAQAGGTWHWPEIVGAPHSGTA